MKKPSLFTWVFISLILSSCSDDSDSLKEQTYRPSKIEESGFSRQLFYNQAGQLSQIISKSQMADGEEIVTEHLFEHDAAGNVSRAVTNDTIIYNYVRKNGRIVSTEVSYDSRLAERHAFSYGTKGELIEMVSYQYKHLLPHLLSKVTYAYQSDGNLSTTKFFAFEEAVGFKCQSTYEYEGYDNTLSVENGFEVNLINPTVNFRKNNPSRMVVRNSLGSRVLTEDYLLEFDESGAKVSRETSVTFHHTGVTGSYQTLYLFEQF